MPCYACIGECQVRIAVVGLHGFPQSAMAISGGYVNRGRDHLFAVCYLLIVQYSEATTPTQPMKCH
jgi:hypothetical protein